MVPQPREPCLRYTKVILENKKLRACETVFEFFGIENFNQIYTAKSLTLDLQIDLNLAERRLISVQFEIQWNLKITVRIDNSF